MRRKVVFVLGQGSALVLGAWVEAMFFDFSQWIWPVSAIIGMLIAGYVFFTEPEKSIFLLEDSDKQKNKINISEDMWFLILVVIVFVFCVGITTSIKVNPIP
ncbi:MAG: hypothetical protein OXC97_05815 [Candidatus Dadabacteria bacterium]|nr:hypothetical protein [Candidatus Dadabacteria bacterium]